MKVHVAFRPRRQEARDVALHDGATVADLIAAVGESVDVVVAVQAGRPVPEDHVLEDGATLTLLSAASGG